MNHFWGTYGGIRHLFHQSSRTENYWALCCPLEVKEKPEDDLERSKCIDCYRHELIDDRKIGTWLRENNFSLYDEIYERIEND